MRSQQSPGSRRIELSTTRLRFQRDGQNYDRTEMISYHTTDPAVPTVFQALRDGAVFLRIADGAVTPVEDHEIPRIAQQYRVPELVRALRIAG